MGSQLSYHIQGSGSKCSICFGASSKFVGVDTRLTGHRYHKQMNAATGELIAKGSYYGEWLLGGVPPILIAFNQVAHIGFVKQPTVGAGDRLLARISERHKPKRLHPWAYGCRIPRGALE